MANELVQFATGSLSDYTSATKIAGKLYFTEDANGNQIFLGSKQFSPAKNQLVWYGTCSTAAATAEKVVTCNNFNLTAGAIIYIKFTTANTVASPTLNINGTGAKSVKLSTNSSNAAPIVWAAGSIQTFIYDGTNFLIVGDFGSLTIGGVWTGTSSQNPYISMGGYARLTANNTGAFTFAPSNTPSYLATTTEFRPLSDKAGLLDLGSASYKWRYVYANYLDATNNINAGGKVTAGTDLVIKGRAYISKLNADSTNGINTANDIIVPNASGTMALTSDIPSNETAASEGTDLSVVTTGEKYTWNNKQAALATQTAYTSKGSATKVPQITTNTLGQVTGITEVDITDEKVKVAALNAKAYLLGATAATGTQTALATSNAYLDSSGNVHAAKSIYLDTISGSVDDENASRFIFKAAGGTAQTYLASNTSGAFSFGYKNSSGTISGTFTLYPNTNNYNCFMNNCGANLGKNDSNGAYTWNHIYTKGNIYKHKGGSNGFYELIWPNKGGTIATTSDLPSASNSAPLMSGTASAGEATTFARADHVHPTDTSRAAASHTHSKIDIIDFPTIPSPASSGTPAMDGTATRGSSDYYARADHVHPTDTSRAAASHTHTKNEITDLPTSTSGFTNDGEDGQNPFLDINDLKYSNPRGTTITVGGIPKGTTFNNVSIIDIIERILYPYVAFSFSKITTSPSAQVYEYGSSKTITTVTPTFTNGSKSINSVKIGTTSGGSNLYSGNTATSGTAITLTTSGTTTGLSNYTIYCTLSDGTTTTTKSATFTFNKFIYYGVTNSTTAPTTHTGLTGANSVTDGVSITTTDNSYIWFLAPAAKTKIQEFAMNQWNDVATTSAGTLTFTTATGQNVTYYAYRTDKMVSATSTYRVQ